ncbi:MAG TPA: type II toxin-antitoxin system RelE/ParE family toxin [Gemmataceae bacterium]|jgi:mRNA-degrading endonuclease RelE of RelBE toxin-antitoxin system
MYQMEFSPEALEDLSWFRKYDRKRILEEIAIQLSHQPDQETRNRKRLRPNKLAEWEARIGAFRIFYEVDAANAIVKIAAVGYKEGNKLLIRGEEREL